MKYIFFSRIVVFLLLSLMALSACQPANTPTSGEPMPTAAPTNETDTPPSDYRKAISKKTPWSKICKLTCGISPLQVHVILSGNLPDGCTTIVKSEYKKSKMTPPLRFVNLYTQRPKIWFVRKL